MIRHRTRRGWRVAAALLAGAAVAGACGGGEDPLEIGFRRVALDLAFKDAEKALPAASTQIIRQYIDSQVGVETAVEPEPPAPRVVRRVTVIPRRVQRECPAAPEGATFQVPAFAVVKDPPKVGTYARHNEGTLSVELANFAEDRPVPALSKWDVPAVRWGRGLTAVRDEDVETLNPPAEVRANDNAFKEMAEFDLTRRLMPGYSVTDTYRYTNGETFDYLFLVKRVSVTPARESVFEPTPPIRMVVLNEPEGTLATAGVVHAGVDRTTNVAMTVQSQIVERQTVDVCGDVVDTYRVQIKEQMVDLSQTPPSLSGNEGESTNYWNIQFDNGMLIVREEVHTTVHTTTKILGQDVPVTFRFNYTSTLDSLEPLPLDGAPAPTGF